MGRSLIVCQAEYRRAKYSSCLHLFAGVLVGIVILIMSFTGTLYRLPHGLEKKGYLVSTEKRQSASSSKNCSKTNTTPINVAGNLFGEECKIMST